MAVTIYDVAKMAGVGIGTVSRVLNDSPNVRPETRDRVLKAIEQLNFRPNPIARSLSLRRTLTVGVIAPFFTRPSFVERLRGVEAIIAHSNYDLIVYNVETPMRRDAYFQDIPRSSRVDGLIVMSLRPTDDDVRRWHESSMPIVLVDAEHRAMHRVIIDDVAGGFLATTHLIELGHRRIGYVSDPLDLPFGFMSSYDRFLGYRKALKEHGLQFRSEYHQTADHGREQARIATHRLLSLQEPPTAIFAASDTQAFGVIEAARDMGRRVPQDLSVIGYDDIEMAEYMSLSTVRQPLFQSGKRGVELLMRIIENPNTSVICEALELELMSRSTTAILQPTNGL